MFRRASDFLHMPYLRYWLLSEEYNKKAECAAPCFFILWRFRLCFLRKTGTWRDDAFLRAAGAVTAPPAPPPGLRPCRHTPSPRAFRPQPFRTSQALSRRRFLRRGRTLGCACGPSAGLAAAPIPRFRALWPRLLLFRRYFSIAAFFRFAAIISEQSSNLSSRSYVYKPFTSCSTS